MTSDDIMTFLFARGGEATFAEFTLSFPPCRGTYDLLVPKSKNHFIWFGLSLRFINLLEELRREGKIKYTRTTADVYKIFKLRPKYPVAVAGSTYLGPAWVPVLVEVSLQPRETTKEISS